MLALILVALFPVLSISAATASASVAIKSSAKVAAAAVDLTPTAVGAAPVSPAGSLALGPTPTATPLTFDVVLQPQNAAALAAYATAASTQGSALYRHFLTTSQFATRFGATPATIAQVRSALATVGLTAGPVTSNGLVLPVTTTVGQAETSLKTGFEQYHLSTGRTAEANTAAPQLPAVAAHAVQAIIGLNDLLAAPGGPPHHTVAQKTGHPAISPAATGPQACSSAVNEGEDAGGWTDTQLAQAYSLNGLYTKGFLGAGTTIALFELDEYAASDISTFQDCYGTSVPITNVAVDGGDTGGADEGEAALDIETLIGLAPKASLEVYNAPADNYATSSLDEYTKIIDDDSAQVLSSSYGLCEQMVKLIDPGLQASENTVFQQAATEGMSVLAASGDTGSEACYPNGGSLEIGGGSEEDAVAVNSTDGTSYVANYGNGTVSVVSDADKAIVATVSLGSSVDPSGVAVDPTTDKVFVVESGPSKLAEINGATCNATTTSGCGATPATVAVGTASGGSQAAAVNPRTGTVYVTNFNDDNVAAVAESTFTVVGKIPSGGSEPYGIGVDTSTDQVYVTNFSSTSSTVAEIDGGGCNATQTTGCSQVPPVEIVGVSPTAVAVDATANRIFVTNYEDSSVSVLDAATLAPIAGSPISIDAYGSLPVAASLSPSGKQVLAVESGAVVVIDVGTLAVTGVLEGAGSEPAGVDVDPSTGAAIVADEAGGVVFLPLAPAVLDIAAQPYVTAVGGTDLTALGPAPSETTWNEPLTAEGAGGGGISTAWSMPSWQVGPGVVSANSSGTPCGASSGDCRELPDVSASADPYNGYVVFHDGAWTVFGGTSAATPLWAATAAVIESQTSPATRLGLLNPDLYSLAAAGHPDFNDVTVGTNDYTGTTEGLYPTTTHYDMATGLGSPIATALATDLVSTTAGAPTVSAISPNSGPTTGGTTVTITGTNFTGATKVAFGTVSGTSLTVVSSVKITVVSPAQGAAVHNVYVTTPAGTSGAVAADDFTYEGAPTVSAISPNSGPTAGGTTVTVTGTNFSGTTKVAFGTVAGTSLTVVSSTKITVVSPAEGAAVHNVYVTTPAGTSGAVAADDFTYEGAPSVSVISPNSGPTAGGTTVTITGANFSGATKVAFGTVAGTSLTVVSSAKITVVSPAEGAAVHNVYVTTPAGTSGAVAADDFTYEGAPTVSAISPTSGPTAGGTTVTVTGTNFLGATKVAFGTVAGTSLTVVSSTKITVVSPAEGAAVHNVYVTTPAGTSGAVAADDYTYH